MASPCPLDLRSVFQDLQEILLAGVARKTLRYRFQVGLDPVADEMEFFCGEPFLAENT